MSEYVTKSGKVLTDADLQALADEAERGYCTEAGSRRVRTRATPDSPWVDEQGWCGNPLPCPIHG